MGSVHSDRQSLTPKIFFKAPYIFLPLGVPYSQSPKKQIRWDQPNSGLFLLRRKKLKHFSDEAWADLVRDMTEPATRATMKKHISGCGKCETALQVWQAVLAIARRESTFIPPDEVVRVSKSQFAATVSGAKPALRLLFDSNLQPVTAGVRGSVSARQFLYETDEYYIDLRLEPRRDSDSACVVGQVLNRTGSNRAAQNVPVRMQSGTSRLAETITNQFGEFQIEFEANSNLCLSIGHQQADEIILPLYGVQKSPNRKDLA
jgi:hypothetical protein